MNSRYSEKKNDDNDFVKQVQQADERIKQNVTYLNHAFRDACERYKEWCAESSENDSNNVRDQKLKKWQVDFSYLMHDLQTGPIFFAQQNVIAINDLINTIE